MKYIIEVLDDCDDNKQEWVDGYSNKEATLYTTAIRECARTFNSKEEAEEYGKRYLTAWNWRAVEV